MARATVSGGRGGRKLNPSLNSKLTRFARSVPGIVGTSIIEGVGGPKAKVATRAAGTILGRSRGIINKATKEAEQVVNKSARGKRVVTRATDPKSNVRKPVVKKNLKPKMYQTTTGQRRKKVSDKVASAMARESAGPKAKAPFGRVRTVAKPNSGRGLSKSEKARDTYYKSNQNPVTRTQGKPKPKRVISKAEKDFIRRQEIRRAISGKPGKRAPEVAEKESKPLRSIQEVLAPLKGKKVVVEKKQALVDGKIVDRPVRMDAEEYVLTRANFRSAAKNPENSVVAMTRAQQKSRADTAEGRAIKEARREEVIQRLREIKDTEAAKTNPKRYSSPAQEYGNVRQTEGLIAKGEKRIQEETARRRVEQEKIARTAKRKKQVEATLMRQKNREEILAQTRKKATISRRPNSPKPVKPGRTRRAK